MLLQICTKTGLWSNKGQNPNSKCTDISTQPRIRKQMMPVRPLIRSAIKTCSNRASSSSPTTAREGRRGGGGGEFQFETHRLYLVNHFNQANDRDRPSNRSSRPQPDGRHIQTMPRGRIPFQRLILPENWLRERWIDSESIIFLPSSAVFHRESGRSI